jgi:serine/threonine-protein kinase
MIDRILNGRYRILSRVGSGGMADVYKGVDLTTGMTVAIKVLKSEYSSDPQYLRRLNREAEAMVSLKNEHIVSFYDIQNEGDIHYIVLEYVDGRTLRDLMDEKGAMEPKEAVGIVTDVLEGLSHAHKKNLVHRDVKPQNIMITADGVIKLADFGIAKMGGDATRTYDGKEAMGSVYYISPEQAKGEHVDEQADIYSVGIMLYEMLLGEPPFSGENAVQVALKHINDDMKPLKEVREDLPDALCDVVARATAKNRKYRYKSADDMKRDLERALKSPYSRFAKLPKAALMLSDTGSVRNVSGVREHLPHIAIIGTVLGIIAVFIAMFLISTSKNKDAYSKVPSFLGYTEAQAKDYAENRGFKLEITGYASSDEYEAGEVCEQSPAPQSKAAPGSVISVTVSLGMETVPVPNLYGMTVEEAMKALEAVGLGLDSNIEYQTSSQPVGTVIGQSVNPEETVMTGDLVRITVCKEPVTETIRMPELLGKDIHDAIELLENVNITKYRLFVTDQNDMAFEFSDGQIVDQSPSGGMDMIYSDDMVAYLYMYKSDLGNYKAEFSENVTLSDATNDVIIVMVTDLGELILYRAEYPNGTYSIPFTGRYWESGSYTCIIYVNGSVYTSFVRSFE